MGLAAIAVQTRGQIESQYRAPGSVHRRNRGRKFRPQRRTQARPQQGIDEHLSIAQQRYRKRLHLTAAGAILVGGAQRVAAQLRRIDHCKQTHFQARRAGVARDHVTVTGVVAAAAYDCNAAGRRPSRP